MWAKMSAKLTQDNLKLFVIMSNDIELRYKTSPRWF